jgi:hypothetical protein
MLGRNQPASSSAKNEEIYKVLNLSHFHKKPQIHNLQQAYIEY